MSNKKMLAWVSEQYGSADNVLSLEKINIPTPSKKQLLVKVIAASLNPIDFRMLNGYGRKLFPKMRGSEFPVTLGRDFSGEIVALGSDITHFKIGQKIVGTVPPNLQGTHAEYVVINGEHAALCPENCDLVKIAAIPYVAMTTWTALVGKAGLTAKTAKGKTLFVHAGSGGVGSFTVQLAKAWGMEVTSTCGPTNVGLVNSLGADKTLDYSKDDYTKLTEKFDYVFDTLGHDHESPTLNLVKNGGQYVTIVHPLMNLLDQYGLILGGMNIAFSQIKNKLSAKFNNRGYSWSVFKANGNNLQVIMDLVDQQKIKPVIASILPMTDLPKAYNLIGTGRTKGKIVLKWS